jgi:hypothetical protein
MRGVGLVVGRQPSKLIYTGSNPVPRSKVMMLRTNRCASALKFGDRGGSFIDSSISDQKLSSEQRISIAYQVSLSGQDSLLRIC